MHTAISAITPLTHKDDDWRGRLMRGMVDFHYRYYHRLTYRDKQPWAITTDQLQDLPKNSVGYHLGQFLYQHGFQLLPKFENHDLFHVLLNYQTTVVDEVRMQCCLAASGRNTFSTWITIIIGYLFYPESWSVFKAAYQRGKPLRNFSYWDFEALLTVPLKELQQRIRVT